MVRSLWLIPFAVAFACAVGDPSQPSPFEPFGTAGDGGDSGMDGPGGTIGETLQPSDTGMGSTGDNSTDTTDPDGATDDVDPDSDGESDSGGAQCGNATVDPGEKCDGNNLADQDCTSQGFDEGTLGCSGDCTEFDTVACVTWVCGNDAVEGPEACDGADLGGENCQSQGFDAGTLSCAGDCTALDTAGCSLFSCGNDLVEGTEECDGSDLNGQSCATQGLEGGTLACAANCGSYDIGACTCLEQNIGSATGAAVATGNTTGEDDSMTSSCGGGADRVIAFTAPSAGDYTIDTETSGFDTLLAVFTSCLESSELACNDDTVGLTSEVSVTLAASQQVYILVDGFGGATGAWVLNINAGAAPSCQEQDIMSNLGASVATGDTTGADEDFAQSCGGGGAVDHVIRFVAPATASFVFDTIGSRYDTVLSAYDTCAVASELACNDDTVGLLSEITVALTAGQEIFVVVSGFSGGTGAWVLNAAQI